jgi:hypothetical protein
LIGGQELAALHTRFAVDTEPEFDFVVAKLESRMAYCGKSAGAQCHAHGAEIVSRFAGPPGDLGQWQAGGRCGSGDLMDQYRTGDPASAALLYCMAQPHVIRHDHDLDGDTFAASHLGGEAEVKPIAGVVLDDQDRTGRAGDSSKTGEDGIGTRRGEHIARHGSR